MGIISATEAAQILEEKGVTTYRKDAIAYIKELAKKGVMKTRVDERSRLDELMFNMRRIRPSDHIRLDHENVSVDWDFKSMGDPVDMDLDNDITDTIAYDMYKLATIARNNIMSSVDAAIKSAIGSDKNVVDNLSIVNPDLAWLIKTLENLEYVVTYTREASGEKEYAGGYTIYDTVYVFHIEW